MRTVAWLVALVCTAIAVSAVFWFMGPLRDTDNHYTHLQIVAVNPETVPEPPPVDLNETEIMREYPTIAQGFLSASNGRWNHPGNAQTEKFWTMLQQNSEFRGFVEYGGSTYSIGQLSH